MTLQLKLKSNLKTLIQVRMMTTLLNFNQIFSRMTFLQ